MHAMEEAVTPAEKLLINDINENQDLKSKKSYHLKERENGEKKIVGQSSKSKGLMPHPQRDKDIIPLLSLPNNSPSLNKAHELSYREQDRVLRIKDF